MPKKERSQISHPKTIHDKFKKKLNKRINQASKNEVENAIAVSSACIDKVFNFRGAKTSHNQALSWPRIGAKYDDGTTIDGVPESVRVATGYFAGCLLLGIQADDQNLLDWMASIMDDVVDETSPFLDRISPH